MVAILPAILHLYEFESKNKLSLMLGGHFVCRLLYDPDIQALDSRQTLTE